MNAAGLNGWERQQRCVRAVVRVDLSRHVLAGGELGGPAEAAAWSVLATVSPGQAVDVNLGAARWLSVRLLYLLREGLLDAGPVQLSGTDGAALATIAALLDGRTA